MPKRETVPAVPTPTPAPALRPPTAAPAVAALSLSDALIQTKLAVGPVGDRFEREADDVAALVVRTLRAPVADRDSDADADTEPDVDRGPRVQRTASRPATANRHVAPVAARIQRASARRRSGRGRR